ncbi:hypothetical protein ACJMK2_035640 [Sinanodonta woodiana]|uniref:Uncharacterized protein n=1 Tax=Sinanodonta woodiana TaxID=1069815 RepID=A0ABD3WVJ1_SINWO
MIITQLGETFTRHKHKMTRPNTTQACSVKPYLTLTSVLILTHVQATVGVFICGQTVCEGKGFDTCQPHPISGKICQPCRDFMEYCNSTSMPQGCNPYCLDQLKIKYEATFLNFTIEGDLLLRSFRDAQENFVKEKAILLKNITQAREEIVILKMTIRNQTIIIDKMQNENQNVSTVIDNKAKNYSTEIESRILNQTQRIPEDKYMKTHREYQDTMSTMVVVAVISSICTAAIVIPIVVLCRDRICKRKERYVYRSH